MLVVSFTIFDYLKVEMFNEQAESDKKHASGSNK